MFTLPLDNQIWVKISFSPLGPPESVAEALGVMMPTCRPTRSTVLSHCLLGSICPNSSWRKQRVIHRAAIGGPQVTQSSASNQWWTCNDETCCRLKWRLGSRVWVIYQLFNCLRRTVKLVLARLPFLLLFFNVLYCTINVNMISSYFTDVSVFVLRGRRSSCFICIHE